MVQESPLSIHDYTVAWVSALAVEHAAAMAMLDEEHSLPGDFISQARDENIYTFGRMGSQNVVLTSLASGVYGTNSAAWTAARLAVGFPSLRASLMVGIGGGVPSDQRDIRLGDVVVSLPTGQHPGVVQYDLGKSTRERFHRVGQLNSPPSVLLAAVAQLRALIELGRDPTPKHLSVFDRLPDNPFSREEAGPDNLYAVDGSLVERSPRKSRAPIYHYGTIASGNMVIKDSVMRDKLSRELDGALCFEMEAAGLMNGFPALVIRGVCDYADSHKHKEWQPYAAATAAAYAKAIISVLHPARVARTKTASESLKEPWEVASGQATSSEQMEEPQARELDGGPRRGEKKKSVRGVIEETESDSPEKTETVDKTAEPEETIAEPTEDHSRILQLLRQPPQTTARFSLFNRTIQFYGKVYLGNGTVMEHVINNQGGIIRNSGGSLNLVGNVRGPVHIGSNVNRKVSGYATRAHRSMQGIRWPFPTAQSFFKRFRR
ncbi:hypothetical protein QQS21_002022 [Conoideocrella luteorostrata]|uniref:Nucleoside phosphorylase domain-containing protein n=1 Tax=Conoideocrella luteorostrata TaxID=1105319 RepID=A0AAJ0CVU2_9HYPO|nr:hypothetical protein QQS21_002022 [Conoideocrella luteorostrata]